MPAFGLKSLNDPRYEEFEKFIPDEITKNSLPEKVDYSYLMPPVQNQENLGTCVSFGCAKLLEFYHRKHHNIQSLVSARAIYSGAKNQYESNDLKDDGLQVSDGLSVISQYYVEETVWPSTDAQSEAQFPEWIIPVPPNLYKSDFVVNNFNTVNLTVQDLKLALFKHGIVLSGVNFANEWFNVDSTGRLQSNNLTAAGGHCMVICGFDDNFLNLDGSQGAFTWSNQWGTSYGHKGYIYLPYNVDPNFFPNILYTVVA